LAAGALPIVWATLPILSNAASKICGALGLTELYRAFSNFHTNSFWLMLAGLVALTIVTIFPRHSTNNDKKKEDDEGARDHKPSQQTLTSDADPKLPEIFIQ
jgi:hypothetical protein